MRKLFCSVTVVAMLSIAAQAASITSATQFATTATGAFDTSNGSLWDTVPGGFYNLWFASDAAGTTFLNGPADSQAAVNLTLPTGSTTYYIFGDPGGLMTNNGLNLFFDGLLTPGISVMGATGSAVFTANGSASTKGPSGIDVAGSNSLTYTSGGVVVTLTAYNWNNPSNVDKVSPFSATANTTPDFLGSFTLDVAAVATPEPATLALTGIILVAGALVRRKPRKV